jgi:hypothetical protein
MVQRLLTRVTRNNTEEGEDAVAELTGFPATARWRTLIPLQEAVPERVSRGPKSINSPRR